jgi:hypothetical protein
MKIIRAYPPNFAAIKAKFPGASTQGVIFAYAPAVYAPTGQSMTTPLMAHEQVHIDRQTAIGVEMWWERYIADDKFRFFEELLAHRAEWSAFCDKPPMPTWRHKERYLRMISERLAGPLYGNMVSAEEAEFLITALAVTNDPAAPELLTAAPV